VSTPDLPPALVEQKSQERDAYQLINRMRALLKQVRQIDLAVATNLTAAPTVIWLSDDMPATSAWDVDAIVLAKATDGSTAGYRRVGRFKRGAGVSALIAAAATPVPDAEDVAGWDVTLAASGNGALLTVTGDVTRTVRWSALIRVRELK